MDALLENQHRSFLLETDSSHDQSHQTLMISSGEEEKPKPSNRIVIRLPVRTINQQQCSNKEAEDQRNPELKMSLKNQNLSSNSPTSISNNSDSSSTTCTLCGKYFPSLKSLFGHMRSHPEREWRGIQPPPPPLQPHSMTLLTKNSPSSTASDDQIDYTTSERLDLYQVGSLPSLPKWSVTGKRGRRTFDSLLSDERIADAVVGLLMLNQGNSLDVALKNKQINRETEATTTTSKKKKKKSECSSDEVSKSSDLLKSSKKLKIDHDDRSCSSRNGFDPKLINNNNIHSIQLEQLTSNVIQEDNSLVKKNSKKLKLDERISCSSYRDRFDPKLIINNNIHSSHLEQLPSNGFQGEFSLVKKNSMFFKPETLMMKANKLVREMERGSAEDKGLGSFSINGFKCHTCNRTFPSHQALGGHKSSQRNCKNTSSGSSSSSNQSPHNYQYQQCRDFPKLMIQAAADNLQEFICHETKTTSFVGAHQCELCGATFGTGQALGGHKRRHYSGSNPPAAIVPVSSSTEKIINKEMMTCSSLSSVVAVSSVGEVISTKTENKPTRDFDLNEIPVDAGDEQVL